jgi:hypothetical protein
MAPKINILKNKDELYNLKQDWSVLNSKSKSNSPFSTWEWIMNHEKILIGGNEEGDNSSYYRKIHLHSA